MFDKIKNSSWKTSVAAIVSVLTSLGALILNPLLDNDPATNPQWAAFFAAASAAWGIWSARDWDKS
jgi:hypothetical protein